MKKWKNVIGILGIVFSLESFGAIGTLPFKTILQNTTKDDLDIYYSICTWGKKSNYRMRCESPLFIHLVSQSSNYQNPISLYVTVVPEDQGGTKWLKILKVTDLKTHNSQTFGDQCGSGADPYSSHVTTKIITFSSLIDNSSIIICTPGNSNKQFMSEK